MDAAARLRAYLGEPIPPGGTDADTLFTNAEITDMLVTGNGQTTNPQRALWYAAAEGWERKAGMFAEMVDNQTGGTNRLNSQHFDHAKERVEHFRELASGRLRTTIGKIVRPGTTIR